MSNILNHNRNIFDFKINKSDYWDFHLCINNCDSILNNEKYCLAVNIDTNDNECIWFDTLYSKKENTWSNAINNGLYLNSIGFTGIDNGLITFDKDKITNKEFLDIFLNSKYSIEKNDNRFILNKVNGNNQIYDYSTEITYYNDTQVIKLNGGFYQGFFKSNNYQVLPTDINNGVCFSFILKKENFTNPNITLNDKHPNNKGFFFYIGTRAENKWWKKYSTSFDYEKCLQQYTDDYSKEYLEFTPLKNKEYVSEMPIRSDGKYFENDYLINNNEDKYFDENNSCCNSYVENDYIEDDIQIEENMKLNTSEGYDLYQPNIIEFKTDNKFITYNHTHDGFTVKDKIDDKEIILYDIKKPDIGNYFTLFNRTCSGYTVNNIQTLIDKENKKYDILADLYNNALGFRITDDGKIGYRYLIKNCDSNDIKIEEEYSVSNIIINVWYKIDIKICPSGKNIKIFIYVNNKLVLVSKELPKLNLRKLDDLSSKQEGVPFNISLGGGTQGLCDSIDINYMTPPEMILPLEKNFAGTFIGYIKLFKFYNCTMNYSMLERNLENEDELLNQNDIYII